MPSLFRSTAPSGTGDHVLVCNRSNSTQWVRLGSELEQDFAEERQEGRLNSYTDKVEMVIRRLNDLLFSQRVYNRKVALHCV